MSCFAFRKVRPAALFMDFDVLEIGHGSRIDLFSMWEELSRCPVSALFLSCNGPCLSCSHAVMKVVHHFPTRCRVSGHSILDSTMR